MKIANFFFCLFVLFTSCATASNIWEAGELTYPNNETEVSAFVNVSPDIQLQSVLCSKNSASPYRFTLLLPDKLDVDTVIKVKIKVDDSEVDAYAEVSGNSLDIQVDDTLMLAIPDSSVLELTFEKSDAEFLHVPTVVKVPMSGSDLILRNVASECTVLCLRNDFKCNFPMLSSILWPRGSYKVPENYDIDALCVDRVSENHAKFNPTSSCRIALDRFYKKEGNGPLSYIYELFHAKKSLYKKYEKYWNEAVSLSPYSVLNLPVTVEDDRDWYLILYSLIGSQRIRDFPASFYTVKEFTGDPTTLIYDIDNRYEMELLKYSSVLFRRVKSSVASVEKIEKALKVWGDFYRQLTTALPNIQQAQAIRPIIYRAMMMRVWNLAGKPRGLNILPENLFKQGSNGRTITNESLESKCTFFEGANGEQFFFASSDCVAEVEDYMRTSPLNTKLYRELVKSWDTFADNWVKSPFYTNSIDDAVGENHKASLVLTIMSLFKLYGFGDYFLLRECISSRDSDICSYELHKAYNTYFKEFNYRLDSISNVSEKDGKSLNELNSMWLDYYHHLEKYIKDLEDKNLIPVWRGSFVKGVACVTQTNAVLNFPYDREELPDISVYDDSDGDDDHMSIVSDSMQASNN